MRRLLFLLSLMLATLPLAAAELPPALETALERLQTDAPRGWGFTQTTVADGRTRVEQYQPVGPEPARWQLVQIDGREPTAEELEKYRKDQILRTAGQPAPNVKEQIDRTTAERVREEEQRAVWRFRLKPGEDDTWAAHMAATFVLHRPTETIEQVELASVGEFSPRLFTNVHEARTVMKYSLPDDERPALLQEITVRVRGRLWGFRSLDSDMTVHFTDYRFYGRR